MRQFGYLLIMLIMSLVFFPGCTKSGNEEQKKRAEEFSAAITGKRFRLTDFYSDKPIDYITSDAEVRAETDLWPYVRPYLLDDENLFNGDGTSNIYQNSVKISNNDSSILIRNTEVSYDSKFVYISFVDYDYNPMTYKLSELSDNVFVIYIDWAGGAKVFSRFEKLP